MFTELVVVCCTIIEIIVIIWGLAQLNREINESAEYLATDLDSKLAAVISNLGINPDAPQINPIQAAIANMIQNRMSQGATPPILQAANGQFAPKTIQNIIKDNKEQA